MNTRIDVKLHTGEFTRCVLLKRLDAGDGYAVWLVKNLDPLHKGIKIIKAEISKPEYGVEIK